jgi:uncharacterized membrane protein
MNEVYTPTPQDAAAKRLCTIVYILFAVGIVMPFLTIIAVIIIYLKRSDYIGSYVESHFRWLLRTFWFNLLWFAIGAALSLVKIGFILLGINYLWLIYRVIKGGLNFNDGKTMYPPILNQ